MELKQIIAALLQLQEFDIKIDSMQKMVLELTNRLQNQKQEAEKEKHVCLQIEQELRQITIQSKQEEGEMENKNELIKKYQQQLSQVKTNKEYAILQQQISGFKADYSLIEEKVLKIFYDIDNINKKLKEEKIILDEKIKHFQEQEDLAQKKINALKNNILRIESEKEEKGKSIPREIFLAYKKISANIGTAVVQLIGNTCKGCSMDIPVQTSIDIKISNKICFCPNCSRIIYA
ncbi:hypothetical protein B9J78_01200 [bacterium Unc6]|nr:hypothetical protein [bacterium Unc6]